MKLAIIGSRGFTNFRKAVEVLENYYYEPGVIIDQIVSGGASGADKIGKQLAEKYGIDYLEFPADWDGLGKRAGFIRNQQIIDACDAVLCFWDGASKGSAHSLSLAKKAKKNTVIIYF